MSEERWTVTGPQSIDVDSVASLKLGIINGRFDIVTHEEAVTRIEVSELAGTPLNLRMAAGRLEIRHQEDGAAGWLKNVMESVSKTNDNYVVISIAVPAGVGVEASTVTGDGLVSGTSGPTRLNTVSGALVSDGTAALLDVNSVSGETVIRDHEGALKVNTVSGSVTATGDLSTVKVNNVSGEVILDLGNDTEDLNANTVSGDVIIRLPHDCGLDLNMRSGSGSAVIDDIRYDPTKGRIQAERQGAEGRIAIKVNSVSGRLVVVRRETEAENTSPASHTPEES